MVEKQKLTYKTDWQLIQKSWPGLYLILNTELEILFASEDLLHLLSLSAEDVTNRKINDIYLFLSEKEDEEDLKWRLSFEYLFHTGKSHQLGVKEVQYAGVEGKKIKRYWLPKHVPVYNENHELQYVIHQIKELTEQEIDQHKYGESRQEVISQIITDGIYEIDFNSQRVSWNEQLYRILGYEVNEIDLDLVQMLRSIHHHDRRKVRDLIRSSRQPEFQIEFRLKTKSGEYIDVLSKGILTYTKKGEPIKLTAAIHDISDYKAQERLKAQLELITSTVPAMICYVDSDLRYRFLNNGYKVVYGDDLDNLIGRQVRELVSDEAYGKFLPLAKRALKGEKVETESKFQLANDETRYYKSTYVPDISAKGVVRGFIGLTMDITKEKYREMSLNNATDEKQRLLDQLSSAHEQLSNEKNVLKGFFMNAPAYISIHEGPQHVVQFLNERAENLFRGQSIVGRPFKDIAIPQVYDRLVAIFDMVYHKRNEFHARELSIPTDSLTSIGLLEERFYDLVVQPKAGFGRSDRGIIVYCNDITDQVRARRALEESARRDRSLLEAMPNITYTFNATGNLEYFNSKWYQITGLDEDASLNRGFETVLHPHDTQRYRDMWKSSLQNGIVFDDYLRIRGWDNVYRWYHSRIVPIKDDEGLIVHWIGTSTDIDEQVKANRKKDEFISIASHELKTPLTSVKAYIQLLQETFAETKTLPVSTYLEKASKNVEKLQDLISELLDLSRIQSGKMELDIKTFKLDDMVKDVVEAAQHSYATHDIILLGEGDLEVKGDRKRLEQILNNLLSNAIKYSPGKDKIEVNISNTRDELRIAVTDYGVGISEKDKDKLFEQFYRSDEVDKRVSGLGIGLFISLEIAKMHGGRIAVDSKKGKGSTFSLILPIAPS